MSNFNSLSFLLCYLFQFSAKVLDLARKQRMNTEVRRNIFCVIMTSEDYLDAFEKLLRFVINHLCTVSPWLVDRRQNGGSVAWLTLSRACCQCLRLFSFMCSVQRMGLKDKQEREIVHVLMDCCLQEKAFNAYYAVLGEKFCSHDRRFQVRRMCWWLRHIATKIMALIGTHILL